MLSLAWITMLLYFLIGLSLYVIMNQTLRELEDPRQLLPSFEGEHLEHAQTSQPKGKPLGSHLVGCKYLDHPYTPHNDWVVISGKVHWKEQMPNPYVCFVTQTLIKHPLCTYML